MKDLNFDNTLQKILKKIFLFFIGTGLITNALYIYGLAYYEGYIESLGFEYTFFPVKWEETLLWSYFASREIGASTVGFWTKVTAPVIVLIFVLAYFIARIWMMISTSGTNRKKIKSTLVARFLVKRKSKYPRTFQLIYPPFKWFLIMEQSIWAFIASYFVLIFLFFIPVFIFIWVYFPLLGLQHGENIGVKRLKYYQNNLCTGDGEYWLKCVELSTAHFKNKSLPDTIYGRIIAKNGSLVAVITENGPVTMTMPPLFFHKTRKNRCYKAECKVEQTNIINQ